MQEKVPPSGYTTVQRDLGDSPLLFDYRSHENVDGGRLFSCVSLNQEKALTARAIMLEIYNVILQHDG